MQNWRKILDDTARLANTVVPDDPHFRLAMKHFTVAIEGDREFTTHQKVTHIIGAIYDGLKFGNWPRGGQS